MEPGHNVIDADGGRLTGRLSLDCIPAPQPSGLEQTKETAVLRTKAVGRGGTWKCFC